MRRALVAAITLASATALVSGATVTAAQASAAQASASQPGTAGHEHFRIIATTAGSRRQSVLATGAFTAGGYRVPGRVTGLRSTDKIVFPSGSFLMARRITRQWLPLPTSACLIRETIRGTYSLSRGTGAFRRISGSGTFAMRIRGVLRKSRGKCGGPMTAYQQVTYAGGKVRG